MSQFTKVAAGFASVLLVFSLGKIGCAGDAPRPTPILRAEATSVILTQLAFKELEVPDQSRAERPPEWIPIAGPWKYVGTTRKGMHRWETAVPFRPRGLFFQRAQPGMALRKARTTEHIRYDRFGESNDPMWSHDRTSLTVYLPEKGTGPTDGAFEITYPKANGRENSLNRAMGGQSPEDFVRTTAADGWDHRMGLLLPAPAKVAWELTVPSAGELHFAPGIIEPEVFDGPPSDGARLVVEVEENGATTQVYAADLKLHGFANVDVDLSRWAGQKIVLRMKTEPGVSTQFDYVFLAEPSVTSRVSDPRRVLMIFIDTLRPDHLSYNGYDRPTSPKLDELVERSVSFDNTRSVAPWTLPSERAVLTGRQPEWYSTPKGKTVQATLREHGFVTAEFAGNVYLSANFDMERDWDFHRVGLWPLAEEVTDDALAWMDAHEGRDSLLQVHYMGCHLPYLEPMPYRTMFAGSPVAGLRDEFHLSDVKQARIDDDADAQAWVKGRYDNNIRYVTDQVGRLLTRMGPNDIVVVYADHGEEFWEHRGFEHGHTLFDELLRVPLIVMGPGLTAGRVTTPTSLLDITPTILDLLDLEASGYDGQSLVPLAQGDPAAQTAFAARDLAFGRPLYGTERWGVLHGNEKWTTNEGREALYLVSDDPEEKKNLLKADAADAGAPFRTRLAEALDRDVDLGWRLAPNPAKGPVPDDLVVTLTVPGGFKSAWIGSDSLETASATVEVTGDVATFVWKAGASGSVEGFAVPNLPLAEAMPQLVGQATQGGLSFPLNPDPKFGTSPGAIRVPLARAIFPNRGIGLTWSMNPTPDPEAGTIKARDDEMNGSLNAMGYQDPTEDPVEIREEKAKSKAKAKAGP